LQTDENGGQPEFLEIAKKNFELFGKMENNGYLTASSLTGSEAVRYSMAAVNLQS
jgi:hypothetical protein